MHAIEAPSAWVARFAPQVAAGGNVLDVACGSGRHARHFAACGHPVVAVDRDPAGFIDPPATVERVTADLETSPWPFADRQFAGIVVTNYMHRPLFPALLAALSPHGVLIYETFARGNERFGKPSNPDFLLAPGELIERVRGTLRILAYEDLVIDTPRRACVQRICAVRD